MHVVVVVVVVTVVTVVLVVDVVGNSEFKHSIKVWVPDKYTAVHFFALQHDFAQATRIAIPKSLLTVHNP